MDNLYASHLGSESLSQILKRIRSEQERYLHLFDEPETTDLSSDDECEAIDLVIGKDRFLVPTY